LNCIHRATSHFWPIARPRLGNDSQGFLFVTFATGQIRDLINQYLIEANSGQYDYVKALAEFSSKDESALTFKKGEVIAVVPKHDAYTEKVCQYAWHFDQFQSCFNCIVLLFRDGFMASRMADMACSHQIL